jgi:hypothetical protein
MKVKERAANYMRLKKDYRDPEDIAFSKWVDDSFPIRSRNFKGEVLFAGSKYDDVYLISELVQIYKRKKVILPKKEKIIVEVMAWVAVVTLLTAIFFLIFN